jgi:hypothetical protein
MDAVRRARPMARYVPARLRAVKLGRKTLILRADARGQGGVPARAQDRAWAVAR